MNHSYAREKLSLLLRDLDNYNADEFKRQMARIMDGATSAPLGAVVDAMERLGSRVITDDNRCTADPLFCVMEKHEIVVEEGYGHDRIVWVDEEGSEASPTQARRLEALHNDYRETPDKWRRLAVAKQDRFVTACFTEQGCKDFLAVQGHNLRQPFTYVFSLFRNEEMKQLRQLMIGMAKEAQ